MKELARYTQIAIRCFLAFVFVTYSAAKFYGAQFITEGPVLDSSISEMSGFELTWSYFGSSALFSSFIAFAQLAGGMLLLNRRTVRVALLILFPMVSNIVLVNFAYDISYGTTVFSLILLGLLFALVALDYRAWISFLWKLPANLPAKSGLSWKWQIPLVILLPVVVFTGVRLITERVLPTCEIAGNWAVVKADGVEDADSFSKLYLMDGGYMGIRKDRSVFSGQQDTDGSSELNFQLTVWPTPEELIWRDRLSPESKPEGLTPRERQLEAKRPLKFEGQYERPAPNELRLRGMLNQKSVTIILSKE